MTPLLLFTLLTLLQTQSSLYSFNSAQALPASMMNFFSYNNPLSALFRNTELNSRNKPFLFSSPTSESSPQTQLYVLMQNNNNNEQPKKEQILNTIEETQEQQEAFNNRETLEIESKYPLEKQQKIETKQGALKLCPPGGRSFFEAFELACPMRRRKKRHTIFGISTQLQPKKIEKTINNNQQKLLKNNLGYLDDEDEEYQNNKIKYRPANISEIMRICCVNGCEFTDFFPHCGPFSTW